VPSCGCEPDEWVDGERFTGPDLERALIELERRRAVVAGRSAIRVPHHAHERVGARGRSGPSRTWIAGEPVRSVDQVIDDVGQHRGDASEPRPRAWQVAAIESELRGAETEDRGLDVRSANVARRFEQ